MFANTLAMKNYPSAEKTSKEFLLEVKDRALKAYENQDYQFEDLVEELSVERNASRNPLFDVMFVLQNIDIPKIKLPELTLKPGNNINRTSKFDLNLQVVEIREKLDFFLEYSTRLFKKETIEKFIRYFKVIVSSVLEAPGTRLGDIDIIGEKEREEILRLSRGKKDIYDKAVTVHRLFEEKVKESNEKTAIVFEDKTLTYNQLNAKANQLARFLRRKGVDSNTIVGLMMNRSVEMIIGVLAILKAGGAYLPVDIEYPPELKKYMLNDSGTSLLLTNYEKESLSGFIPGNWDVFDIRDTAIYTGNEENLKHVSKGADLLYVIYTSGTTGRPKGVMLEHRNIVNLFKHQFKYINIDFRSVLQFTTISFDVSFQEMFSALLAGGKLVLIARETRENIAELMKVIERNKIVTLFLSTSFLKFVFNEGDFLEQIPQSVKHIVTAGEQLIVSDGLRRYLEKKRVYLHNHYGPTETHVVTALTMEPSKEVSQLPSIGRPISNTVIYILNQNMYLQPIGVCGEIYIGGVQVARGYLGRVELTWEKFITSSYPGGEQLFKTGDLARWQAGGDVEFLGRIDHQVKIRGYRIELGEIVNRLLNHEKVKEAEVIVKERMKEDKYLCAYIVTNEKFELSELKNHLSRALPAYMMPSYFVSLDKMPLTPNGKIDWKALPEPELGRDNTGYAAPRHAVEMKLTSLWSDVLGIEKEKISIDDNFFQLGGHSLKATIMVAKIYQQLGVELPLVEVFKRPTIRGLAENIADTAQNQYSAITPAERKEYYQLSSAQKRLFILNEIRNVGIVYNLPTVWMMEGTLDKKRLENIFAALIKRHEVLRTSFTLMKGKPVQIIHEQVDFQIQSLILSTKTRDQQTDDMVAKAAEQFIKPFDLSKAPLLNVALLKLAKEKHLILFDMHHIITDGVSMAIFITDFMTLYNGEELPPLRIQYKDFSEWQTGEENKTSWEKQETYWLDRFKDGVPILNLPTDHPRPSVQSFAGDYFHFTLSEDWCCWQYTPFCYQSIPARKMS
jgi:amino acid adenylation domain-containing protein